MTEAVTDACAECRRPADGQYRLRWHFVDRYLPEQEAVYKFCTQQHLADFTHRLAAERGEV